VFLIMAATDYEGEDAIEAYNTLEKAKEREIALENMSGDELASLGYKNCWVFRLKELDIETI